MDVEGQMAEAGGSRSQTRTTNQNVEDLANDVVKLGNK